MRKHVGLVAAAVVTLVAVTACMPPPAGRGPAPNYTVSTVVGGLDHVWDVAFAPGNWMVYDERAGNMWAKQLPSGSPRLLGNLGALQASPAFVTQGEGGLLGLAIDPSFSSNHFLYACYDTTTDIRVVRFTVDPNFTASSLAIDSPIVTGMAVNTSIGRHSGCRPRFRPASNPPQLFVGTGDTATPTAPGQPSVAQNLQGLGGKILCVDRDGNPCAGNPGIGDPNIDDRIWSWGHRNVQGIAFTPGGLGYSVEHGTDRDDEINFMFQGNFGWDPSPGYDETKPMTGPGAIGAIWSSGSPTIAPSGATFLTGSQWKGWNGAMAVSVLKGAQLRIVYLDDQFGLSTIGFSLTMTGAGRLRSAVEGPDGDLYVTTDNGGGTDQVLRTVPS
ncbi:MAG TPA: PQQ-dependent sugar dehydrogenase [Acidimicrobiia bacterium]|jgi:glucose/arabinose dehydrogenase